MDKEKISIGCPDPFSVAELIEGKKIDWSKKKDTRALMRREIKRLLKKYNYS